MTDVRLSKVQRNQLAKLAERFGLDLSEFEWSDENTPADVTQSLVRHRRSGAYLRFGGSPYASGLWLSGWPNSGSDALTSSYLEWPNALNAAGKWLEVVAAENEAVDLWAAAHEQRAWISDPPGAAANTPFNTVERDLLAQHLKAIEAFIVSSSKATDAQRTEIRDQLKYLAEATSRLGRFDWRGLAVSTFIGIVLQLGLTPERANSLMSFASNLLGPFVAGAAQLLPGH